VWQALTDPALLARWLMPNDFKPVTGHTFTFRTEPVPQHGFDGIVHCEVLDLEPPRLLRFSWRAGKLGTVVSWSLVPEGTGTRLLITHDRQQLGRFQVEHRAVHDAVEAVLGDRVGAEREGVADHRPEVVGHQPAGQQDRIGQGRPHPSR